MNHQLACNNIECFFRVAFRSVKVAFRRFFADRKTTLMSGLMLTFLALFPVLFPAAVSRAQETASETSEQKAKAVHDWADSIAGELTIRPVDSDSTGQLVTGSMLRWTNPIVGEVFGDCYLWTHENRPLAFLSVYAFFSPQSNRRLTFQSLCESPLVAQLDEQTVWEPKSPGFAWLPVSGLPQPAGNPSLRQRQMRRVAGSFSATVSEKDDALEVRRLRLLARPLHQYQSPTHGISEGALFAFVDGTDPELLLIIECTQGDSSKMRIAPVRQNHRHLKLQRDSQPVWTAELVAPPFPNPKISDPTGIYFNTRWDQISR